MTSTTRTQGNQFISLIKNVLNLTYQGEYVQWCKKTGFLSRLPEDTKARNDASKNLSLTQTSIVDAFRDTPVAVRYTDAGFMEKCIAWMVSTNQVSNARIIEMKLLTSA